ncbi:MAG: alanyl-tRNA synthetase [Actinomycetota bacterium]
MNETPKKRKCPAVGWVKRFGVAGLLFFLIKGLLWLIVPALVAYFAVN